MERQYVEVAIKRVSTPGSRFPLPRYESVGAAGVDLAAALEEPVELAPGERRLIPTGIAIALPSPDLVALVYARSGLAAKHSIALANGVGVVDSDYRGEILCPLYNGGSEPFVVNPGDRIAQLVVTPVLGIRWREAERLPSTERGSGGFGSTGSKG